MNLSHPATEPVWFNAEESGSGSAAETTKGGEHKKFYWLTAMTDVVISAMTAYDDTITLSTGNESIIGKTIKAGHQVPLPDIREITITQGEGFLLSKI